MNLSFVFVFANMRLSVAANIKTPGLPGVYD